MAEKTLESLEYEIEIPKIAGEIKKQKAKRVLLQFPEGLKPYAMAIKDELDSELKQLNTGAELFIWLDSCYGACDVPFSSADSINADLIVQLGHSKWEFGDRNVI